MGKGWGFIQQLILIGKLAKDGNLFSTTTEEEHTNDSSEMLNAKKQPLHSLSMSDINEVGEKYVGDFLNMLSRGLFVFASMHGSNVKSSTKKDELKLRVLSFEHNRNAFVISPLEKHGETYILLAEKIQQINECTASQGISINYEDLKVNIVLSTVEDRNTLLNGLNESLLALASDE